MRRDHRHGNAPSSASLTIPPPENGRPRTRTDTAANGPANAIPGRPPRRSAHAGRKVEFQRHRRVGERTDERRRRPRRSLLRRRSRRRRRRRRNRPSGRTDPDTPRRAGRWARRGDRHAPPPTHPPGAAPNSTSSVAIAVVVVVIVGAILTFSVAADTASPARPDGGGDPTHRGARAARALPQEAGFKQPADVLPRLLLW